MTYQEVRYEVAERICTIALNRPQARNGYTLRMADELNAAFTQAEADEDVRVIVFTGEGTDFCVGADLSGGGFAVSGDQTPGEFWQEPAGRCSRKVFESSKPVIAAIRGAAVGAGSTIVLPADFRLAATDTRFGFVFARRGIVPEGASTWFLPRLVGMGKALDWMVSGRVFHADEALAAGLVTSVYEPEEVLPAAYELARELIRRTSPVSVAVIRQMLYGLSPLPTPLRAHQVDSRLVAELGASPDAAEGVTSFLQRRDPQFPSSVPKDLPQWLPWASGPEGA